jgi:mRNA (2'-O-methyladenosine-N6-)-methyltransferase
MAPDVEDGDGAVQWEKEGWEAGIKELARVSAEASGAGSAQGVALRNVVPSTPEIDALRPKSPTRGGSNNYQNNQAGMNTGMSGGVAMGMPGGRAGVFNNNQNNAMIVQNPMMVSPMMGMGVGMSMNGMGGMDGMGVGAWPGMGMGMGGGVGVGMGPGAMAMGNPMGINMMGMQNMGMSGAQGGFGMPGVGGWDGQSQAQGQGHMDGIWDGGGMGEGMMGMANIGMAPGMGGMEQWGQGGYEGY